MDTIDRLSAAAEKAADTIADTTRQAADALGEKGEQLKSMEEKCMKNCRASILDYPITSISIAMAAGFILSRVMQPCGHKTR